MGQGRYRVGVALLVMRNDAVDLILDAAEQIFSHCFSWVPVTFTVLPT